VPELGQWLWRVLYFFARRPRRPAPPPGGVGGPLLFLRFGRHEMQTCVLVPSASRLHRIAYPGAN